ncbi:alkylhydroperoxidase domain protein [Pseudomonas sp. LRF_L74]|uniref:alkylhydroperoxidase domain protein n=1 Tax=Pseudomonas sp. LRF_L74 TaxID=3369422 RepID=UPI003F5DD22B
MSTFDLLDRLAEIPSDSALAAARATRDAATRHTQGSYDALFTAVDEGELALAERLALARLAAQVHADDVLSQHYGQRLQQTGGVTDSPRWRAALAHAEVLASTPLRLDAQSQQALVEAGWSVTAIVILSQVVAFVSYQSRLRAGYRLILGERRDGHSVAAGDWHRQPVTLTGNRAPTAFTQQALSWEAWLQPLSIDALSGQAREALSEWELLDHPYFRLLARDLPILIERRLADLGIFFARGGLPRAERELAAAVTSKVNGCIFCASVHASRASQLSKRLDDVQRVLDVAPGGRLNAGQDERWAAQIDFAASLAATPAAAGSEQLQRLREHGLDDLQLLDLVQSVAFFSWANRLMLSLGEPYFPAE